MQLGISEIEDYLSSCRLIGRATLRDDTVPRQSTDLADLELSGLKQIREALEEVEELRKQGLDARVEIVDTRDDSGLRMTLRSFRDLQQYLAHQLSKMLMNNVHSSIPLDDFEKLVLEASSGLLSDSDKIRGTLIQ